MSAPGWHRLVVLARVVVTLGAAWLVFSNIDWNGLATLPWRIDLARFAFAAMILVAQFQIMVWRWRIIIEMLGGKPLSAAQLAIVLGRSMLIGQPLPSTVGGDVARVLMLSGQTGSVIAARSVICDRVLSLAVLMALVTAILPFFSVLVDHRALLAVAGVSLGGLAVFCISLAYADRIKGMLWIGKYLAVVAYDCRRLFDGDRRSWIVVALSLAIHLLGVGLIYELAHAIGSPISLLHCLMIVPPMLLISAMPISLGGWGLREGALAAGFTLVGASAMAGVTTSVLFGLTGPLMGIVVEIAAPFVRIRKTPPKDAT